jgi:hypothetical protein
LKVLETVRSPEWALYVENMGNVIHYKVEFRKETNWVMAIFLGAFILALIAILGTIIYGLIGSPGRISFFAFPIILMILAGAWVLDRFLWQIRGKEIVLITDKIEIIKNGKLYATSYHIALDEIEAVSFDDDRNTSFWIRLYGISGGKLVLEYLGRKSRVGQDISLGLAEIVAKEMDYEIRKLLNNFD